jgi:hypothetical protein
MSCTKCKQKGGSKEELTEIINSTTNVVVVVIIIWTLLGAYGLYSLISKFI